jgi:c-di-GMP-related signal transduction protein
MGDFARLLPPKRVVIEIVEQTAPERALLEACAKLKSDGYLLALDDVCCPQSCEAFLDVVDIIKVDFQLATPSTQKRIAESHLPYGVTMLAEKVETHAEWEHARECGYSLYQGFYFCKPIIMTHKKAPSRKSTGITLLKEVAKTDFSFDRLEKIFKQDPVYSLRLLKLVNSSAFGLNSEIHSIRQALVMLGISTLRKWLLVLVFAGFSDRKATVLSQAVVRARFCERLAPAFGLAEHADEIFLTGLFSLLDAILDQRLTCILDTIPVSAEVKSALLGQGGPYRPVLDLVKHYERGEWTHVLELMAAHRIDDSELPSTYQEAIAWAQNATSEEQVQPVPVVS